MNYLEERLKLYGISEQFNETTISNPISENKSFEEKHNWFELDQNGNIKILFKTLDNRRLSLHVEGRKTVKKIYRTCLSPTNRERIKEESGKKIKYLQDKGTGSIIFHTQGVIDAYLNEQEVDTLYLVEGEFKAFVAWMHSVNAKWTKAHKKEEPNLPPPSGLPIMGITGIRNLADEDKDLHRDIMDFIRVCKPKNIVFIMDADFRSLPSKYDPADTPDIDLGKRLKDFYKATIDFRSMAKGRVSDLYLLNIKEEYLKEKIPGTDEAVKGLDDVFAATDLDPRTVVLNLVKSIRPKTRNVWFESMNISTAVGNEIKKHFLLTMSKGAPNAFYRHHAEVLADHEFRFNACRYQVNNEDQLEMTIHGDSESYVRVSGKYYKQIHYPDAYGNQLRELVAWPTSEIKRDYVDTGHKNFFYSIPKYDRFVVVPENNPEKFEQIVGGCFNLYYPIEVEPRKGKWPTIKKYLEHLFGERKDFGSKDQIDVALDWITLAWRNPTQKLPAICLVSEEKSTGKSIFLELMKLIFQDNAVVIGNQEITDRFNDDYITKNIIGLNESFIDKKSTIEKIKTWITERNAQMDTKNVSRVRVDMFAKILMTSNNVTDFIRIDEDESRFWVRYIHPFEGPEIPDLLDQMAKEVPAFIEYLRNERELAHEWKTRLYFKPEVYATQELKDLQKEGKSQLYKNVKITISDQFVEFNKNLEQPQRFTRLYYSINQLCELIYGKTENQDKQYLSFVLQKQFKIQYPEVPTSKKMPIKDTLNSKDEDDDKYTYGPSKAGRYYEFKIEDFLSAEALKEMKIDPNNQYDHDDEVPF